jgi:hypothetical protein
MKSIATIFGLVQDGTLNTKEQATKIVEAEAARMAEAGNVSIEQARKMMLVNIGYQTGYCSHQLADRIMDLFQTEHPIFGKTHPTAEEALRLGMEFGRRSLKENTIDKPDDPTHNDH